MRGLRLWATLVVALAASYGAARAEGREEAMLQRQAAGTQLATLSLEADPATDRRVVTLSFVGDAGFAPSHAPVRPDGVSKHGRRIGFAAALAPVAPELSGDLNIANLETVVTADNRIRPRSIDGFRFRTHPNGVKAMIEAGINAFSLANNHSYDYGRRGIAETLTHLEAFRQAGDLNGYAGLGRTRAEAIAPAVLTARGASIAFSSIGIGHWGGRAGAASPGQPIYGAPGDLRDVAAELRATRADLRVLSIHYGVEDRNGVEPSAARTWRRMAAEATAAGAPIALFVGHHSHTVRAVEKIGDSYALYGLGNFVHQGMANRNRRGLCKDFGLVLRVHLAGPPHGSLAVRAIEAAPITNMHFRGETFPPAEAAKRIAALNHLAERLPRDRDGRGAEGVRFRVMNSGSGLYCAPGAEKEPDPIGALCHAWAPPAAERALKARLAYSCGW